MSVWEAIATGWDGGFVPPGSRRLWVGLCGEPSEPKRSWQADRVWAVLRGLGPTTHVGLRREGGEGGQLAFYSIAWCCCCGGLGLLMNNNRI